MSNKKRLGELIEEKRQTFTELSDNIWGHAETRFEEKRAAEDLCSALEAEGFTVEREAGGVPYAFVGTFGSGEPTIGFLGEYDALSGLSQKAGVAVRDPLVPGANGHGCGHHLLGVGAFAAAVALKQHMEEQKLSGTVKYYGCPGEEGGSGKAFMARAGIFDGLDAAITWHSGSTTAVTSGSSLANIQVYYKFKGKASHAAASPHLGRSALDAVELMSVGVNYMREHMISDARVHYAIVNGGGKSPNVVQPEAEVIYLIRSPKNSEVQELFEWVNDIARGAAMMTQTEAHIQVDKACSNLVPNLTMEKLLHENLNALPQVVATAEEEAFAEEIRKTLNKAELEQGAKALVNAYGGPEGRKLAAQLEGKALSGMLLPHRNHEKPMMGSTDVSDVSWIAPTVQCTVSCWALGTPGHSWQQVAQGKSSWAHKGMLHAAKAMAGTGLDLMTNPELLKQAKADLKEQLGGEEYKCPIPDGVKPAAVK